MNPVPTWAEEWVKANMAESMRRQIDWLKGREFPITSAVLNQWAAAYDQNFPHSCPRYYGKPLKFTDRVRASLHILVNGTLP